MSDSGWNLQRAYDEGYADGKRDAASPWHRVEEELPEIGQIVLVYDEWRRLSICQLDNSYRWLRQGGGWFNGPCACYWMPIEPPDAKNRIKQADGEA